MAEKVERRVAFELEKELAVLLDQAMEEYGEEIVDAILKDEKLNRKIIRALIRLLILSGDQ